MTTPSDHNMLSISEAIQQLHAPDGVICFKLNGRYVLSCDPYQEEAVKRINELKGRREGRPLVMIFEDLAAVRKAEIHSPLLHILPRFAPLITVSIPAPAGISSDAHKGIGMLGIGLVDHGVGKALLSEWGGPLLVSSANLAGEPSPRTKSDVLAYGFQVPIVWSSGEVHDLDDPPPRMTVVTLTASKLKVLSAGQITQEELDVEWARLKVVGLT